MRLVSVRTAMDLLACYCIHNPHRLLFLEQIQLLFWCYLNSTHPLDPFSVDPVAVCELQGELHGHVHSWDAWVTGVSVSSYYGYSGDGVLLQ